MSRLVVWPALIVLIFGACGRKEPTGTETGGRKPVVMTTFYPTQYFTERIAGNLVTVRCPVPPDEDPIFWQPDAETIGRYQKADLIVLNGAEYAKWVKRATLPLSRVVETAKPFEGQLIRFKNAIVHTHGPSGKHSHEGIDGHTWLDPVNAKVQAGEIRKALLRLLPGHEKEIESGFAGLATDLDRLDRRLKTLTEAYDGGTILASHPAYNYLARRYGWDVVNLALDPETMPSGTDFAAIAATLAKTPARFLLWESDPKPEIAERLADRFSIRSVTFSPCEVFAGEDYMAVMERNLENLEVIFEKTGD